MKLPSACLALLIAGASAPSRAAPYAFRGIRAPAVFLQELSLTGGQHYILSTTASSGVDPIMHVLDFSRVELARDDDSGGSMQPRLDFVPPATAKYYVVVHSYSVASAGTGTFSVNGIVVADSAYFGGYPQTVSGSATASRFVYETALRPDGAAQTQLFALDCGGKMLTFDIRGGVGVQSRIAGIANVCRVIVGAANGLVNFYVNDLATDADGDGLGRALEAEIGTCDSTSQTAPSYCSQVFNPDDTDRDGLTDAAEVFGIDDAANPQYLPRWGANPLHKDAFVEIDWIGQATNPLTPGEATIAAGFYRAGSATDLIHRDDLPGISGHFDLGVNPPFAGSELIVNTTYGNWGGSNEVTDVPNDANAYIDAPATNRVAVRSGVFRYGLVHTSGGGQGQGDRFNSGVVGHTVAHELGHTLGLQHWGQDKWGGIGTACKPNYPSLMNYSYAAADQFSRGAATTVVNPASINETIGIGGDAGFLAQSPWYLELAPSLTSVSFNRDGQLFSTNARAAAGWAPDGACGALDANAAVLAAATPLATPDIVRVGGNLYAFYAGTGGTLKYRFSAVELDGSKGSCPLSDDLGQSCASWSGEFSVPIASPSATNPVLGVSAATLGTGVQLAFRDQAGNLRLIQASGVVPPSLEPNGLNGSFSGWSADTTLVRGVLSDPELSPVYLSAARFGETSGLGLFYADASGYRWRVRTASGTSWLDQGAIVRKDGSAVLGNIGIGVAPFPSWGAVDPGASFTTMCAAVVHNSGDGVTMLCYDKSAHQWADLWRGFNPAVSSAVKPSLAYHVFRDGSGRPLTGDVTRGQFWMTLIPRKKADYDPKATYQEPRVLISKPLDRNSTPWVGGSGSLDPQNGVFWSGYTGDIGNVWSVAGGTGAALYEDARVTALKGLWMRIASLDVDVYENRVEFLPLADGTYRTTMKDGDDFQVMERGLCAGLRGSGFCGSINVWGY